MLRPPDSRSPHKPTDPFLPGTASVTGTTANPSLAQSIIHGMSSPDHFLEVVDLPADPSLPPTGPVVENVKDQHVKTKAELSNLAATRTTPPATTASGQQLTHYHSFFSSLLSWENPRASGIAFASVVAFIFAARYLDILRYTFKLTWMTLGVTVLAEAVGKTILGSGLTSQFRPRKYYTIPKATLDAVISDLHELINFFVIESQRVVFVENVFVSAAVSTRCLGRMASANYPRLSSALSSPISLSRSFPSGASPSYLPLPFSSLPSSTRPTAS